MQNTRDGALWVASTPDDDRYVRRLGTGLDLFARAVTAGTAPVRLLHCLLGR